MAKKILVIDDDHDLGTLVETVLKTDEFHIYHAYSGPEGLRQTYDVRPDLIVLDIMMPGMDGIAVCIRLKEIVNTPILMLTALSNEKDVIRSFNAGADDYLKKPFSSNELKARVNALLRRSSLASPGDASHITGYIDPVLEIDFSSQMIKLDGKVIELSPKEFDLLAFLVRERGKVIPHQELVRQVWGNSYTDAKSIASLYIFYLRKKLQDGKRGHQYIRTFWGRGYWFAPLNAENKMADE